MGFFRKSKHSTQPAHKAGPDPDLPDPTPDFYGEETRSDGSVISRMPDEKGYFYTHPTNPMLDGWRRF